MTLCHSSETRTIMTARHVSDDYDYGVCLRTALLTTCMPFLRYAVLYVNSIELVIKTADVDTLNDKCNL